MQPRVWYINISSDFTDTGVLSTQVISRVQSLATIVEVTFIGIQALPDRSSWASEAFHGTGVAAHVFGCPRPFPYSLLRPANAVATQIADLVAGTPGSYVEILHCRFPWAAQVGMAVRAKLVRRGTRAAVIYDMEGVAAEEATYADRLRRRPPTLRRRVCYAGIHALEASGLRHSDRVLCVSDNMMEFIGRDYGIDQTKVRVVQSTADARIFHYSAVQCAETRQALGLQDDQRLFLYSGSLTPSYQTPDLFLTVFCHVVARDDRAVLLILTRDTEAADTWLRQYQIAPRSYRLACAHHSEVARYLNAADWGFCIRSNDIVNTAASPTKMAEYICSGVPTIVSPWTGDYGTLIPRESLGRVVADPTHPSQEFIDGVLDLGRPQLVALKQYCADYGRRHLTHQASLPIYQDLYGSLADQLSA